MTEARVKKLWPRRKEELVKARLAKQEGDPGVDFIDRYVKSYFSLRTCMIKWTLILINCFPLQEQLLNSLTGAAI